MSLLTKLKSFFLSKATSATSLDKNNKKLKKIKDDIVCLKQPSQNIEATELIHIESKNLFKKLFLNLLLILGLLVSFSQAHAISVSLTGMTLESGTSCGTSVHRFSTNSTWNGQSIDLLLTVTAEDNDLANNCIVLQNGNIRFNVKDNDGTSSPEAWMGATLTVVQQGTATPVAVDRLVVTGFDLDDNGQASGQYVVNTDDMYFLNPDASFLSENTNIAYSTGSFFGGAYNAKLKGQPTTNCDDSQASPTPGCRASAIFKNTSSINFRVQNDDAYSHTTNQGALRAFYASFRVENLEELVKNDRDYGDASTSYPSTSQGISAYIALGNGLVPDGEATNQASTNANGDDTDGLGSAINFDDEDGVTLGGSNLGGQTLLSGATSSLNVTTFGSGFLNIWVDLNGDGAFSGAGEQLITNQSIVNTGETNASGTATLASSSAITNTVVPLIVPSSATAGDTVVRVKFTESQNPGNSGNSSIDGEVEDYQLTIETVTDLSVMKTLDTTGPYTSGQSVTYTLSISNAGTGTATNLVVTDLPTNLTVTSATGPNSSCVIAPASGVTTSVICSIASLAVSANETITLVATTP